MTDDESRQGGDNRRPRAMLVILAVFCCALLGVWLLPSGGEATENRTLASFPHLRTADWTDPKTFTSIDAALRDRIRVRSTVASAMGLLSVNVLGKSTSKTIVLGDKTQPFYSDDFTLPCLTSDAQHAAVHQQMADYAAQFAKAGKYLLYVVPPDKSSIRSEALGGEGSDLLSCATQEKKLYEQWAKDPSFPLITMWDQVAALDKSTSGGAFFFGDSHWTWQASALMTTDILKRMVSDGRAPASILSNLTPTTSKTADPDGDLYRLLALSKPQREPVITFSRPGVTTKSKELTTGTTDVIEYHFTSTTSSPSEPLIPGRTLLIRDSFSDYVLPQLPQFFSDLTVINLWDAAAPGPIAAEGHFDTVIVERVQRDSGGDLAVNPVVGAH